MYRYILFDLDGTLMDPGQGITNSFIYALEKLGMEVPPREQLYQFIGPPLKDCFLNYYGFSEEETNRAISVYREYFGTVGLFENEVYPGVYELLERLKSEGKHLILATSKPELFTHQILERFNLAKYFEFVAGATMDSSRVNKGDVIAYALKECGITDLDHTVMIGDRKHDTIGANLNHIDSIGVTYSYGCREEHEKAGATHIAQSMEALSALL